MNKIRRYENLHIVLWLLKDSFWLLHWKTLGSIMIAPTVLVALIITVMCHKEERDEFWINLAVLFWISGNSYWMLCEFNNREDIKDYAVIPFILGMASVGYFYYKRLRKET